VDEDEKGPYIVYSEVEKAIKEIKDKKDTENNNVPGKVIKLLEDEGLKTMTQLVNSMQETGQWPTHLTEVTIAL
jgi:hypothetical protein